MTKFRIAIQEVNPKHKHIHNIMFETEDINLSIDKIRKAIEEEIKKREELLNEWLLERQKTGVEKIIAETNEDLIDWKAKGHDISKEEYIQNEFMDEFDYTHR